MIDKIKLLGRELKKRKCDYYLISTFDEYQNEYAPLRNMRLKWLTGFSGSNGIALISEDKKYFFTDGRYLLQAKKEIDKAFKIIDLGSTSFFSFIRTKINKKKILLDFKIFNIKFIKNLMNTNSKNSLQIINDKQNSIDKIWKERPLGKKKKFFIINSQISGCNIIEKKKKIIENNKNSIFIITSSESVCWLLNIRGYDLDHTPVVFSKAIIFKSKIKFFVDLQKIPKKKFKIRGVDIINIEEFDNEIIKLSKDKNIFLDKMAPYNFYDLMLQNNLKPDLIDDPCKNLKSKKNKAEIKASKAAHIEDGLSLVKFFCWLTKQKFNSKFTEYLVAKKLEDYRKNSKLFFSLSFPTISASGPNGSIIHYQPEKKSRTLRSGDLYLCDSGGQYIGATTDVTRTIFLGTSPPNKEFIVNYTRVLLGHINLAMTRFPVGTYGFQIDSIARYYLWKSGLDYKHGTGHGVGSFLSVHEGPQSISKRIDKSELKPGMVISNEPGFYKDGYYGIRIENLLLIKKSKLNGFLEFEDLTLFPYEKNLIDEEMLTNEQKLWIDNYHSKIYKKLSKFLNKKNRFWLLEKTKKIF